jgi:hypothetical protein
LVFIASSYAELLQRVIDCLQSTQKHTNWCNAEVTVYDLDDNSFRIISGQGKHLFVVSEGDNGEAEIVNIKCLLNSQLNHIVDKNDRFLNCILSMIRVCIGSKLTRPHRLRNN